MKPDNKYETWSAESQQASSFIVNMFPDNNKTSTEAGRSQKSVKGGQITVNIIYMTIVIQLGGLGECCKLPPVGYGATPQPATNFGMIW